MDTAIVCFSMELSLGWIQGRVCPASANHYR
jgi:hypothetical protein